MIVLENYVAPDPNYIAIFLTPSRLLRHLISTWLGFFVGDVPPRCVIYCDESEARFHGISLNGACLESGVLKLTAEAWNLRTACVLRLVVGAASFDFHVPKHGSKTLAVRTRPVEVRVNEGENRLKVVVFTESDHKVLYESAPYELRGGPPTSLVPQKRPLPKGLRYLGRALALFLFLLTLPLSAGVLIWLWTTALCKLPPDWKTATAPLYRRRVVSGAQSLTIYKFRTLQYRNAETECDRSQMEEKKGDRFLWGAPFVRATGLDEMLQLLSVARGIIAWFGYRPFQVESTFRKRVSDDVICEYLATVDQAIPGCFSLADGLKARGIVGIGLRTRHCANVHQFANDCLLLRWKIFLAIVFKIATLDGIEEYASEVHMLYVIPEIAGAARDEQVPPFLA